MYNQCIIYVYWLEKVNNYVNHFFKEIPNDFLGYGLNIWGIGVLLFPNPIYSAFRLVLVSTFFLFFMF